VRAHRPERLPVVLLREEASALLSKLHGVVWLMALLMYGAGLRLLECAELRVKDLRVTSIVWWSRVVSASTLCAPATLSCFSPPRTIAPSTRTWLLTRVR
jgi:integrase